jgi:hypothetical protein
MNRINAGLTAFAVAMALLSTSTLGEPLSANPSHGKPSVQKKIAFHVIGLMKTKSGAT